MSGRKSPVSGLTVCHLSDINLGYRRYNKVNKAGFNQREADVALVFREAIDRIVKLKPSVVIIAGDLFWSVRPTNSVLSCAFTEIKRLQVGAGCPVIIVAGNRESPRRKDTGSPLRLLAEIDGVYIADIKSEVFKFKELSLSVCCIPHSAVSETLAKGVRADDAPKFNILVMHGQVAGVLATDSGGAAIDLKQITAGEWDYIALGHSHLYAQVSGNTIYSGSIERTASDIWAQSNSKCGFVQAELPSGKHRFHELTSVREVIVPKPIDAQGLSAIDVSNEILESVSSIPSGITGKIIRLAVNNVSMEAARGLDYKQIRKFRGQALNFSLELHPAQVRAPINRSNRAKHTLLVEQIKEFAASRSGHDHYSPELPDVIEEYLAKIESENEANQSEA